MKGAIHDIGVAYKGNIVLSWPQRQVWEDGSSYLVYGVAQSEHSMIHSPKCVLYTTEVPYKGTTLVGNIVCRWGVSWRPTKVAFSLLSQKAWMDRSSPLGYGAAHGKHHRMAFVVIVVVLR